MKIDAHLTSIEDIFQYKKIEVPPFQRNFAWSKDQVVRLFDSLEPAFADNDESPIFLGPITVFSPSLGADLGVLRLVDGQQRITTFSLIFFVIRDLVTSLSDDLIIDAEGNGFHLSSKMENVTLDSSGVPRLEVNYQIRSVYKDYISAHPIWRNANGKNLKPRGKNLNLEDRANTEDLRSAYFAVERILRNEKWLGAVPAGSDDVVNFKERVLRLHKILLEQCLVVQIAVDSYESAFDLFETLNDTGVDLTQSDLVKSYLLAEVFKSGGSTDEERIAKATTWRSVWDDAVKSLNEAGAKFPSFLRHFLIARDGDRITDRKIFTRVKQIVEVDGVDPARMIKEISDAAVHYNRIVTAQIHFGEEGSLPTKEQESINECAWRLEKLAETYRIAVLCALLQGISKEELLRLIRVIEALTFRLIVTGAGGQETENNWASACKKIKSHSAVVDGFGAARSELLSKLPSIAPFFETRSSKKELIHYVMTRIGFEVAHVSDRRKMTIEHLAPQKPLGTASETYWYGHVAPLLPTNPEDENYVDFVSKWGNLTLLEMSLQLTTLNFDWSRKKATPGLGDSTFALTTDLIGFDDWTSDLIDERSDWILARIDELTSQEYLDGVPLSTAASFSVHLL